MPPSVPPPPAIEQDADEIPLAWSVHLVRRHPQRAWVIGFVGLACASVGAWALRSWLGAAIGLAAIVGSTAEFLLPQRFTLTSSGAMASVGLSRSELTWARVRRVVLEGDSMLLSPLPAPSRLDAFRGVRLLFAPGDPGARAIAIEWVRRHTGELVRDD